MYIERIDEIINSVKANKLGHFFCGNDHSIGGIKWEVKQNQTKRFGYLSLVYQ